MQVPDHSTIVVIVFCKGTRKAIDWDILQKFTLLDNVILIP